MEVVLTIHFIQYSPGENTFSWNKIKQTLSFLNLLWLEWEYGNGTKNQLMNLEYSIITKSNNADLSIDCSMLINFAKGDFNANI